uniref:Ig-like domain-containing protein n=1 Tax=Sphaeramia orbicularis TaxID=375764 RepID=A0A672ZWJ3_9TELE
MLCFCLSPILYFFFYEKEIVTGGTCFIKKDASSSSLELHSVKPSDSAKYTCQVSNDAGKVDCTTVLFVKGPPMFVRKLEATKLVTSSDSARLECKVAGSPIISFKWFKDMMEISSSSKYTMRESDLVASLEVMNCKVEDSGDYVCVASSEAGSDRCSSTVTVKGWFGHGRGPSTGVQAPTEVYYSLQNVGRHRITVKDDLVALQILAVEAGDVGSYQCTVENEVGRDSCDCQITLKGSSRNCRPISEYKICNYSKAASSSLCSVTVCLKPGCLHRS